MPQVIQAKCPHCRNVLRIPSEWLSKPIRCKHCKQTFQAKAKPPAPVAIAAPATAAKVAVAQPAHVNGVQGAPPVMAAPPRAASNDPFGFDDDDTPTAAAEVA